MIQFELEEETVPEVPKPEQIKAELLPEPVAAFPVLDIEAAKLFFAPFLERVDEMFRQAEAIIVNDETTKAETVSIGTKAMSLYKKLEKAREELVAEPWQYVKSINSLAHGLTDKLYVEKKKGDKNKEEVQTVVSIAKQKITQFNVLEEQKRRGAEERLRKATEEAQAKLDEEAKTKGFAPAKLPTAVIPKKSTVTRTETGSSHSVKFWTFEIIEKNIIEGLALDIENAWSKVVAGEKEPAVEIGKLVKQLRSVSPFLLFSDTLIREGVNKGGIREIPGVRIWEKDDTKFKK